jgi:hypothetical protein
LILLYSFTTQAATIFFLGAPLTENDEIESSENVLERALGNGDLLFTM